MTGLDLGASLAEIDNSAKALLSLFAIVAAFAAFFRWVAPRYRRAKSRVVATVDTIAGREAITDSITGRELAPAIPSIGERMATHEGRLDRMVEAVAEIARNHQRIDSLEVRVDALERSQVERIAGKPESIQLFRTIETALGAEPQEDR